MVELGKLTPDDWQELRDLRIQATKEVPFAFGWTTNEEIARTEEDWRKRFADSTHYSARENGKLLGVLCVSLETKRSMQSHIAKIFSVYVAPEVRGQGVGKMLMDAAIDDLKKNSKIVKITLNVAETQGAARRLYENAGFKQAGILEKEGHLGDKFVTVFVMEKFLR